MNGYDVDHFRARVLQDALTEATARYWVKRGQTFVDAAPRPGDYNGNATTAALEDRRRRCLDIAAACQEHAQLHLGADPEPISATVITVMDEIAVTEIEAVA